MNERALIFKEFLPKDKIIPNRADRLWVHPNGCTVVLLDGVSGCANPVRAVEECIDYLNDCEKTQALENPSQLLLELHAVLANRVDEMVVAACVHYSNGQASCAWVGNPRLYLFTDDATDCLFGEPLSQPVQVLGMEGEVLPLTSTFTIPKDGICLLTSDGLGHQALLDKKDHILKAHTNLEWQRLGESSAVDSDWSFVAFPIEQTYSYENPAWPYNPFVGPQEDYEHEKRGLAQVADALFAEDNFRGFRIVGGTRFVQANSSRLLDGILVSPWGVVLMELKDHDCKVHLPLSGRQKMVISYGDKLHNESNPVAKVTEALRPFSDFDLGCEVRVEVRNIGAVIFTHPRVEVVCQLHDGTQTSPPLTNANVIVATPKTLPDQLRSFVKKFVGKRNPPPLDQSQIDAVCAALTQTRHPADLESGDQRMIGKFLLQGEPNVEESTSYYQVFDGKFANRDRKVWVKKFERAQLARGTQSQIEESRLREVEALDVVRGGGVQQNHGHFSEEDGLFVILEHVDGLRLDQWLENNPSREERIDMLKDVAETLVVLGDEQIVHRGLSPHCIRIRRANGKPVLINFELCQMDVVATLPLSGRRLLDLQYVAKEVHTLGANITCAADIYSLGKIICLALSGELPFRTFENQPMSVKKPGFWGQVSNKCGLTAEQGKELAKMLSENPARRPSAQEVVTILEGWK